MKIISMSVKTAEIYTESIVDAFLHVLFVLNVVNLGGEGNIKGWRSEMVMESKLDIEKFKVKG